MSQHEQSKTWKYFRENELTHSGAHFLMTIHELKNEHGYARSIDIAKKLDIAASSAHLSLKSLKKKEFVMEDDNKFVSLTPTGQKLVEHVQRTEKAFEAFFTQVLGVEQWQAEVDACKIEHLMSEETVEKMEGFLRGGDGGN